MIAKSDTEKATLLRKVAKLKDQLAANNLTPNDTPDEVVTVNEDIVSAAAKCIALDAKASALEKSNQEWKLEKSKLQKVVGNLKVEIEDLKVKLEERKSVTDLSASQASLAPAKPATTTSSWFNAIASKPSATSTATSSDQPQQVDQAASAIPAPASAPGLTVPSANTAISWWTRSVSPAAVTALPLSTVGSSVETASSPSAAIPLRPSGGSTVSLQQPANAPVAPATNSADGDRIKALEQEVQSLKRELESSRVPPALPALPEKASGDFDKLKADLEEQVKLKQSFESKVKALEIDLAGAKSVADSSSAQLRELQTAINANLKAIIDGEEKIKTLSMLTEKVKQELSAKTTEADASLEVSKDLALKKKELEEKLLQLQNSVEIASKENLKMGTKLDEMAKELKSKSENISEHETKAAELERNLVSKSK